MKIGFAKLPYLIALIFYVYIVYSKRKMTIYQVFSTQIFNHYYHNFVKTCIYKLFFLNL